MTDTPQAGWYPDPNDATQQRYWDGTAWTEHTAAGVAQAAAPAAPSFAAGISAGGNPNGPAPDPWLWQSIVVTLLCCMPFGIAGIVNASKANSLIAAGDIAGATVAAQKAKKWTLIGVGSGIAVIAIYLVFVVIAFSAGIADL
ncbi:MAG: hypothetical protein ACJA2F_001307 [Nitriliruptoraceae bacterium]